MVEDIGRGNISAVSVSELASGPKGKKSDNLQYNTLVRWFAGTNDSSSTKRLMFQVLSFFYNFLQNSLPKSFQFMLLFSFNKFTKI